MGIQVKGIQELLHYVQKHLKKANQQLPLILAI